MTGELNMNHDMKKLQYRHRPLSLSIASAVAILVITSFLIQFFNRVIGTYAPYRLLVTVALIILLVAKKKMPLLGTLTIASSWIPMLIMVAVHLLICGFNISSLMDWYTYFIGYVFIALIGENENVFRRAFKVITFFGLFYAVSVWIQLLLPPVYTIWLKLLPVETAASIQRYSTINGLLTGFSSNPGFTAGHVVTGILAAYSQSQALNTQGRKLTIKTKLSIIVLVSSILLIGKRGHLLALLFALILSYLIYNRGKKRMIAINILLIGTVVLIPTLLFLSDWLSVVPAFGRISDTIVGVLNGDDVTSGRSKLFAHALLQFQNHPVFGIGWGNYRSSVIGTVTLMTELDTHNIYLQLLCETGIVGLVCVAIPMIVFLIQGIKNIGIIKSKWPENLFIKCVGLYSLSYQLFFLVYGISGNPLYDYNYAIMYFVSCAITALIYRKSRKEHITI